MSAGWAKTSSIRPPVCVHQRMALAALHLLPGIIAAGTAALGGPDRLAVEDRGARACFAPDPLAIGRDQGVVDGLERRGRSMPPSTTRQMGVRSRSRSLIRGIRSLVAAFR